MCKFMVNLFYIVIQTMSFFPSFDRSYNLFHVVFSFFVIVLLLYHPKSHNITKKVRYFCVARGKKYFNLRPTPA